MGRDHLDFILAHLCTCRCNLKLPQNLIQTKRLISFVLKKLFVSNSFAFRNEDPIHLVCPAGLDPYLCWLPCKAR